MKTLAFVTLLLMAFLGLNHCDNFVEMPVRFRRRLIEYTSPYIKCNGGKKADLPKGILSGSCEVLTGKGNLTELSPC